MIQDKKSVIMHQASCISIHRFTHSSIHHFALLCSLFFALLFLLTSNAFAKDAKEEYKKIQDEMETHKQKIEKTRKREHSVLEELDVTNRDINKVQSELRKQRERLRETEGKIRKLEREMAENREKIGKQNDWLKRKLRIMQRHGYSGDNMLLLSTSEDISQLLRRWRYIKDLASYDHKMMQGYKETIKSLSEQEENLGRLRAELKGHEEKTERSLSSINDKKKDKEMILASVRKERSSYEKMLRELKESSQKLLEIIRQAEESEKSEKTPSIKGFQGLKGWLQWPVDGRIAIPYGAQKDPQFKTPVFRNGVHIKADEDSSAKSVYKGKVVYADWFKGYGQLVIVSHGEGYHTLYANLSEIFYKVGDIIKERDVIGRVGESGTTNVSGLYFEIRYKGKPLDPTQWLKRR